VIHINIFNLIPSFRKSVTQYCCYFFGHGVNSFSFGIEDLCTCNTERRTIVLQPVAVRHAALLTGECRVSLWCTERLSAIDPITNQRDSKQCDAFWHFRRLSLEAIHYPRRGSTHRWSRVISVYMEHRPPHMLTIYAYGDLGIRYSLIYHQQNR
jgi:hypothetical protein